MINFNFIYNRTMNNLRIFKLNLILNLKLVKVIKLDSIFLTFKPYKICR